MTSFMYDPIVGEGIYVERGRIQWLGKDPNFDCTIRVANLDLRDAGTWVCEIGSSTKESFQVQTKEFVIDIESRFTNHMYQHKVTKSFLRSNLIIDMVKFIYSEKATTFCGISTNHLIGST